MIPSEGGVSLSKAGTWFLLLLATVLPIYFFNSSGTTDVPAFMKWISNADRLGIRKGFIENAENYPPIPTILLEFTAKVASKLNVSVFVGFKSLLFLFLFLTSLIFYFWTRSIFFAVMMQLTLLLNSVALCYIDILFAPTFVGALFALYKRKLTAFAVLFTLSCLTKFQPLIIAPFLFVYLVSYTRTPGSKSLMPAPLFKSVIAPTIFIVATFFMIFGSEIGSALIRATLHHPQISANAMNADWILTYFLHRLSPETYGPLINGRVDLIMFEEEGLLLELPKVIFAAVYLITLGLFLTRRKSFENLLLFSLLGYVTYFILDSGVHENHLFLAAILGWILYAMNQKYKFIALALAVFSNLNLFIFYGIHGSGFGVEHVWGIDLTVVLSFLAVILFLIFFVYSFRLGSDQQSASLTIR